MHGQEPQAAEPQAARDCLSWTWKTAWLLWQNVVTKQKGVCMLLRDVGRSPHTHNNVYLMLVYSDHSLV